MELNCSVAKDPEVQAMLLDYQAQIKVENIDSSFGTLGARFLGDQLMDEATCESRLGGDKEVSTTFATNSSNAAIICGCRVAECGAGKLITDAVQWYTGADIAVINGGAIRDSFPSGPVSRGDVLAVMPFDNTVAMFAMTGAQVLAMLQHGISGLINENVEADPDGKFLQVSSTVQLQWSYQGDQAQVGSVKVASISGGCSIKTDAAARANTLPELDAGVFEPLDLNGMYCVATSEFLANGGDGFEMLAAAKSLPGESFLKTITSYIETFSSPSSEYSVSNWGLVMVAADADPARLGPRAGRFVQSPSLLELNLGLLCVYSYSGGADREECDHMLHTIDMINDKNDGFYDDLLVHARINVVETECGCSDGTCVAALMELQRHLPKFAAAIGPSCSSDVVDVSSIATRATTGYEGVFISASSTAPSVADDIEYPLVSRACTNEKSMAAALAAFVHSRGWQHIGVLHDDSVWGAESAEWFVRKLKKLNDDSGRETKVLNHMREENITTISASTTGFKLGEFFDSPYENAKKLLLSLRDVDVRITAIFIQPKVQRWLFHVSFAESIQFGKGYLFLSTWMTEAAFYDPDTQELDYKAVRGAEGQCGIVDGLPTVSEETQKKREEYAARWGEKSNKKGCLRNITLPANHSEPLRKQFTDAGGIVDGQAGVDPSSYCDSDGAPKDFPSFSYNMIDGITSYAKAMDKLYLTAPLDAKQLYQNMLDEKPFDGLTGKYVLDRNSGDLAGGVSLRNMQFDKGDRMNDGRRDRRYVTLSETKAVFINIGSYINDTGLIMYNDTDIIYPGPTEIQPIDREIQVVVDNSTKDTTELDSGTIIAVSTVMGSLVLALVLVASSFWYRHRKEKNKAVNFADEIEKMREEGGLSDAVAVNRNIPREINRKNIQKIATLGKGAFGEVWKAILDESNEAGGRGVPGYIVAVKTVLKRGVQQHVDGGGGGGHNTVAPSSDFEEAGTREAIAGLLREAAIMALVDSHLHVLTLIGVVSIGMPMLLLVPYCEHGKMLDFIRKTRLANFDRIRICKEIALGMAHLGKAHLIHRDLAARNILMDSTRSIKIADFGLSQKHKTQIFKQDEQSSIISRKSSLDLESGMEWEMALGLLEDARETNEDSDGMHTTSGNSSSPMYSVRWTAPESMVADGKFTVQSDIWSYGVVIWELFTNGKIPYHGKSNLQILDEVTGVKGPMRLYRPSECSVNLFAILKTCWSVVPADRPSFEDLAASMKAHEEHSSKILQATAFLSASVASKFKESVHIDETDVMISYHPEQQQVATKIRTRLNELGFTVWFDFSIWDTHGHERLPMTSSSTDADRKAVAVEKAGAVIYCISEDYKNSKSCHDTANYAHTQKKAMLPVMVQEGYAANDWLGFLLGSKLWYGIFPSTLKDKAAFEMQMDAIAKAIQGVKDDKKKGSMDLEKGSDEHGGLNGNDEELPEYVGPKRISRFRTPSAIEAHQRRVKKKNKKKSSKEYNVMISYNWTHQDMVKRIRAKLADLGFSVWFDIEQMQGSTVAAMAKAVEQSQAIVYCLSKGYMDSDNCQSEASYANQQKKPMLPLLVDEEYTPNGWLATLLGSNRPINFFASTTEATFNENMKIVASALSNITDHSVLKDSVDSVARAMAASHTLTSTKRRVLPPKPTQLNPPRLSRELLPQAKKSSKPDVLAVPVAEAAAETPVVVAATPVPAPTPSPPPGVLSKQQEHEQAELREFERFEISLKEESERAGEGGEVDKVLPALSGAGALPSTAAATGIRTDGTDSKFFHYGSVTEPFKKEAAYAVRKMSPVKPATNDVDDDADGYFCVMGKASSALPPLSAPPMRQRQAVESYSCPSG